MPLSTCIGIAYEDASTSADERVVFPDYVDDFIAIGFEEVGRVLVRPEAGSLSAVAAHHGDRHAEFYSQMTTPNMVLRSPSTPAFVDISWFFGGPSIRIRTQLEDGYLIETLRTWDNPPWDRPDISIDKLMLKNHAPTVDRSTQLMMTSSCIELWAAHHSHVKQIRRERKSAPTPHADLQGFTALAVATDERDRRYRAKTAEQFPAGQNRPLRPFPERLLDLGATDLLLVVMAVVTVAVLMLPAIAS